MAAAQMAGKVRAVVDVSGYIGNNRGKQKNGWAFRKIQTN
jgi:hypothetical protein